MIEEEDFEEDFDAVDAKEDDDESTDDEDDIDDDGDNYMTKVENRRPYILINNFLINFGIYFKF